MGLFYCSFGYDRKNLSDKTISAKKRDNYITQPSISTVYFMNFTVPQILRETDESEDSFLANIFPQQPHVCLIYNASILHFGL